MALKPKLLIDIKTAKRSPFRKVSRRLNLYRVGRPEIYLIDFIKPLIAVFVAVYLILGSVVAPISPHSMAAQDIQAERQALEEQLLELERQIDEQEITISEYRAQRKTLQREIDSLDAQIKKLSLQIRASNVSINKLGDEISDNESQIVTTEQKLENSKQALIELIQRLYEHDRTSLFAVMLQNSKLSDFFGDVNDLLEVQNGVTLTVSKITDLRNQLIGEKEQLAIRLGDVEALKRYQAAQRDVVEETKTKKDTLLKVTKGEEEKYQALLEETKKTAAEVRSQIFKFLGGGELDFPEAVRLAKFAESATGVNAAFILAVLDQESGLGQNVGKCKYDENPYYPARANNPTTMHPTRDIPVFLEIVAKLGLSRNISVSCPIPRDGAYGGAMGPAQFIPSTWVLYEDKIKKLVGDTPSPWNNGHAILATALYLKDSINSRTCQNYISRNSGVLPESTLTYMCAGGAYYGGLGNALLYRHSYGAKVADKAVVIQEDMRILNSSLLNSQISDPLAS
jgi:peptidoglycan hydrolase CwlO-like protein